MKLLYIPPPKSWIEDTPMLIYRYDIIIFVICRFTCLQENYWSKCVIQRRTYRFWAVFVGNRVWVCLKPHLYNSVLRKHLYRPVILMGSQHPAVMWYSVRNTLSNALFKTLKIIILDLNYLSAFLPKFFSIPEVFGKSRFFFSCLLSYLSLVLRYEACHHCLKSLEPPLSMLRRLTKNQNATLPLPDSMPTVHVSSFAFCPGRSVF